MKQFVTYPIAVFSAFLLAASTASAQFNVQITVNSATVTTTCTDVIGAPDPLWAVNVANTAWVVYPQVGACFTALPNVQFDQDFQCLADVPPFIQVCFRAFENDPNIFVACDVAASCLTETCVNVPVPLQGSQNASIQLPAGQPSGGQADLTITSTGIPGGINDLVCDAIDIGVLAANTTVGDADTSVFNNFCGTNFNEPDPQTFGIPWVNNRAVWYQFTTSGNPGSHIRIAVNSDPSNFGDPVNLQVALFNSSDNTCTGTYSFAGQNHDPADWDELIYVTCPQPNTTFFIMVDGVSDTPEEVEGYFGIEVTEMGVEEASELRCGAESLGAVPLGGAAALPGLRTNACSGNSNMAPASAFGVQRSVWFSFQPPLTGHVLLTAASDTADDPIGLQVAVYRSSDNSCTGVFTEVFSQHTAADLDETFELHCLDPALTYFIQVDGALGNLNTGIFTLTADDAGDETPKTTQNLTLCAGESIAAGGSTYSASGSYSDTLTIAGGCDSIVFTNLTVLVPVVLNFAVTQQGLGAGNTDGVAQVAPTGGTGSYTFAWSDGQASAIATGLVGGDNYCVTTTDGNGCTADTCFEMPFFLHFQPTLLADTLDCFGDSDGTLRLTAIAGAPPYQFTWQNSGGSLSGNGTIDFDGQIVVIPDLPAGSYSFHIADIYFDTTVTADIVQPDLLELSAQAVENATCFGLCDGSVEVAVTGGVAPYQLAWSNGGAGLLLQNLCTGSYQLAVTDANGCTAQFDFDVSQPAEFIATAAEVQPVSCFQGSDGVATVTTNGSPASYLWSSGDAAQVASGLSGGIYTVTVTNADGCTATDAVSVTTPGAPVGASIEELESVVCHGDENGSIRANTTGPGLNFSYLWSSGDLTATSSNLGTGTYSVTVQNENGCSATASFALAEPSEITVQATANKLTCLDPADGGVITVTGVGGGVEPYLFSSDGTTFSQDTALAGYTAGQQPFFVEDAGGCVREFSAVIEGPQELLVDLGEDAAIDLGQSIALEPVVNQSGVTYLWEPAELLSCADCPEPSAKPVESVTFTLTVADTFGCTASDSKRVEVRKVRHVYVPNAFSPDGDGINDEFVPFGGQDVSVVKTFKIFDRQGNLVHAADNFQPGDFGSGWNGRFKGKVMQPAVFVWFAEIEFLDAEVELFRGDVTLLR